jgi:hypothetical protein
MGSTPSVTSTEQLRVTPETDPHSIEGSGSKFTLKLDTNYAEAAPNDRIRGLWLGPKLPKMSGMA